MIINGNQKVITINKPTTYKENFVLCSQEAMFAAMRDLSETKAGFALWMYLVKNQPNHQTALSSKDFMTVSGYKIKAYNAAVEALIEKGYLVKNGEYSYNFFEKRLMLSKDKDIKECRDEDLGQGLSSGSTSAYDAGGQGLSSGSTTNNINNISNNIKDILAAAPQTITLKEARKIAEEAPEECRIDFTNGVLCFKSGETLKLEG